MSITIKQNRVGDLYGKQRKIKKIYVKRRLAYTSGGAALWTLYDRGYVEGVNWSGNRLPHQNYYNASVCGADFSHAEESAGGYMRLTIDGTYSLQYNTHVCGSAAVTVPSTATKMKVVVEKGVYKVLMRFGLLTEDCVNSMNATNGGVLTSTTYVDTSGEQTFELTLPQGIAGGSWVPVINMFQTPTNSLYELKIHKVWFE